MGIYTDSDGPGSRAAVDATRAPTTR